MNKFGYKLRGFALASAIAVGAFSLTACGTKEVSTKEVSTEEPSGSEYETNIYYIEGKYYSFDIDDVSSSGSDTVLTTTDGYQIASDWKYHSYLRITDPEGNVSFYKDWARIDPECLKNMESHEIPSPFEDIDLE